VIKCFPCGALALAVIPLLLPASGNLDVTLDSDTLESTVPLISAGQLTGLLQQGERMYYLGSVREDGDLLHILALDLTVVVEGRPFTTFQLRKIENESVVVPVPRWLDWSEGPLTLRPYESGRPVLRVTRRPVLQFGP
jgi:hypothetical protein